MPVYQAGRARSAREGPRRGVRSARGASTVTRKGGGAARALVRNLDRRGGSIRPRHGQHDAPAQTQGRGLIRPDYVKCDLTPALRQGTLDAVADPESTVSRWSVIHVRKNVEQHRERIHQATEHGEPIEAITDPLELLRWARWLVIEAHQLEEAAVIDARRDGVSWSDIGATHGVTRQAAHDRWGAVAKP